MSGTPPAAPDLIHGRRAYRRSLHLRPRDIYRADRPLPATATAAVRAIPALISYAENLSGQKSDLIAYRIGGQGMEGEMWVPPGPDDPPMERLVAGEYERPMCVASMQRVRWAAFQDVVEGRLAAQWPDDDAARGLALDVAARAFNDVFHELLHTAVYPEVAGTLRDVDRAMIEALTELVAIIHQPLALHACGLGYLGRDLAVTAPPASYTSIVAVLAAVCTVVADILGLHPADVPGVMYGAGGGAEAVRLVLGAAACQAGVPPTSVPGLCDWLDSAIARAQSHEEGVDELVPAELVARAGATDVAFRGLIRQLGGEWISARSDTPVLGRFGPTVDLAAALTRPTFLTPIPIDDPETGISLTLNLVGEEYLLWGGYRGVASVCRALSLGNLALPPEQRLTAYTPQTMGAPLARFNAEMAELRIDLS